MTTSNFNFGDESVAGAYSNVLVPIMFEPWAKSLIEAHGPWLGRRVLDVATGTGIVARLLAEEVGGTGSVTGTDMNQEMLDLAVAQCQGLSNVKFVLCPAEELDCDDNSFDYVVCQQGVQFFSDKRAAAQEMLRVLIPGGIAIASAWRPVSECQFFGQICNALESIDEPGIADMMKVPFNFMPREALIDIFQSAGFSTIDVERVERGLKMEGGPQHAIDAAYATPIGPSLRALPDDKQASFVTALTSRVEQLSGDATTIGQMASDVLVATK